jgi:hypothetical protein
MDTPAKMTLRNSGIRKLSGGADPASSSRQIRQKKSRVRDAAEKILQQNYGTPYGIILTPS